MTVQQPLYVRLDDWFWAGIDLRRVHSSRWFGPGPSAAGCALLLVWRIAVFGYLFGIVTYEWCVETKNWLCSLWGWKDYRG